MCLAERVEIDDPDDVLHELLKRYAIAIADAVGIKPLAMQAIRDVAAAAFDVIVLRIRKSDNAGALQFAVLIPAKWPEIAHASRGTVCECRG